MCGLLAHRARLELVLRSVNVEHGREADDEPPPGPFADAHEFAHVLLDASHGDVLRLENINKTLR